MALILLIDDDTQIRAVLCRILRSAGHEIVEAEDGKSGLRRLADSPAELVITDILMPEKDGIEAIEEMRRAGRPPKIIAMTGGGRYQGFEFLEIAKWLGADALLTKPFRRVALLDAVTRVLRA